MLIEKIISKRQNAFIRGRQMLESFLVVNESKTNRLRIREPGVLHKVDIKKVYDHTNCEFLLCFPKRCSFGEK